MGMLETGGDFDLFEEPLCAEYGCEFGTQDFHRHLAVVFQVLGEIHRRHTTSTDLALYGIAIGEGGFETVEKVRHCVLAPLATVLEYGLGS